MKAVILAGGMGTRFAEETSLRPKPMIEIGGKPILWHIMKMYSKHGVNDFVICLGYKGYMIKEYFSNYFMHMSDVTIDLGKNSVEIHQTKVDPWRVTLIDTGQDSMTGGRLGYVRKHVGTEAFCMTYGDGVSDVNIRAVIDFHKKQGKTCTVTAVQPPGRFGALDITSNGMVEKFLEKPTGDGNWINGGFFVMEPRALDLIDGDACIWEQAPLKTLAKTGQLAAYKHTGYWQPMDTLRDKMALEDLWMAKKAPWKTWE